MAAPSPCSPRSAKGYVPKAWFNDHAIGGGGDNWYYPYNTGWDEILLTYLSNNTDVFQCPTDEVNLQRPTNQFGRPIPGSYRINASNQAGNSSNGAWATAYKIASLVNATQSILVVEGYPGNSPWDYTEWQHVGTWEGNNDGNVSKTKMWNVAQDRHPRNKANYLFADSHVESLEGSETWTPISGGTITMWRCLYPAGSAADVP